LRKFSMQRGHCAAGSSSESEEKCGKKADAGKDQAEVSENAKALKNEGSNSKGG